MRTNQHELEQVDRRLSEVFGQRVDTGGGPSMVEIDRRARVYRRRVVGLRVASAVVVVGLIVAAVSLRSGGGGTAGSPNDAKALAQLKEYCNSTTIPLGTYANGESVRGMCYYCFGQTTGVSGTGPGCKPGETVPPPTDPALICGGVPAGPPLSPVTTMVDTPTIVVVDPSPNAAAESRTIDCLSRLSYRFVFAPPGSATRLPRSGVTCPECRSPASWRTWCLATTLPSRWGSSRTRRHRRQPKQRETTPQPARGLGPVKRSRRCRRRPPTSAG